MDLVFATNNKNKIREIQSLIGPELNILSLKDINCSEELPEDQNTLEGNAYQKSSYVYEKYGKNCFADDTGLEVEALNGEPGVFSARYAGESKDSQANMDKVLKALKNKMNRNARFRTVISLIIDGEEFRFEGIVNGKIIENRRGTEGFGYDPVFVPDGYDQTFAEMPIDEKNQISHRSRAIYKLLHFLKETFM
jgi:XTP/dITP diphosphohydrolase